MNLLMLASIGVGLAAIVVIGLAIGAHTRLTYDPRKPKGPPRDVPPPLEFRRKR